MNHEQRAAAVRQNDGVLAGKIVRAINQIEADCALAAGGLSERLIEEVVHVIEKAAAAPWQVLSEGQEAQVVCPEWRMTRGVGIGDAWFELAEICPEDEGQYSWISVAIGGGKSRMGLELTFRRGLQDIAVGMIADDKQVAALLKAGMQRDEDKARLFFPIDIPAEALAQGFEQNDLAKALIPVTKAVEKAIGAKAELDKLVEAIRAEGKRK